MAGPWQERGDALASAYLALARRQLADGIGAPFEPVIGPHERPFATINADILIAASLAKIQDPMVKALPVIGVVDQVSDLTPVLNDPHAALRMMTALPG